MSDYEPDRHWHDVLVPEQYEHAGDVAMVAASFLGWSALWCYLQSSKARKRQRERDQVPLIIRLARSRAERGKKQPPKEPER